MKISFEDKIQDGKRLLVLKVGKMPRFFGLAKWRKQYCALLILHNSLQGTTFYEGGTFDFAGSEVRVRVDSQWF